MAAIKPDLINLMSLIKGFGTPAPGEQSMAQEFPEAYPSLGFGLHDEVPPMSVAPPAWLESLLAPTLAQGMTTNVAKPTTPQNEAAPSPMPATAGEVAAGTGAVAGWSAAETNAAMANVPPDTGGNEPVDTGQPPVRTDEFTVTPSGQMTEGPPQPPQGPVRTDEFTVTPSGTMTEGPPQQKPAQSKTLSPEEVMGPELWALLQERATREPGWWQWLGVGLQGSVNPAAAERTMATWRQDQQQAQAELGRAASNTAQYNAEAQRQEMRDREITSRAETEAAKAESQLQREQARQRSTTFRSMLTSMKSPAARAKMMEVQNIATKAILTEDEEAMYERAMTEASAAETDFMDDQTVGQEVLRLAPLVGKGDAPEALLSFTISKIKDPAERASFEAIAKTLGAEGAKIRASNMSAKTAGVEAARIRGEASQAVARMQLYGRILTNRTAIEREAALIVDKQNQAQAKLQEAQMKLSDPNLDEDARQALNQAIMGYESSLMAYDSVANYLQAMRAETAEFGPPETSTGTPSQLVDPTKPVSRNAPKMRFDAAWQQTWDRSLITAAQSGFLAPSGVGTMDARRIEEYILTKASPAELDRVADVVLDNMEYLTGLPRDRIVTELNSLLSTRHSDLITRDWTPNILQGGRGPTWVSPTGPAATNTYQNTEGQPSNIIFSQQGNQ